MAFSSNSSRNSSRSAQIPDQKSGTFGDGDGAGNSSGSVSFSSASRSTFGGNSQESMGVQTAIVYGVSRDNTVLTRSLEDAATDWKNISGGSVVSIAFDRNQIYGVGTDQQVYLQNIDLMTTVSPWSLASRGDIISTAIHAGMIYGVGTDLRVYSKVLDAMMKSSWTPVSAGDIRSIAIHRDAIYGVGTNNKVYMQRLKDMTIWSSWTLRSAGEVISIAIKDDTIYGVGTNGKVFQQALSTMAPYTWWLPSFDGDLIEINIVVKDLFRRQEAPPLQRIKEISGGTPEATRCSVELMEKLKHRRSRKEESFEATGIDAGVGREWTHRTYQELDVAVQVHHFVPPFNSLRSSAELEPEVAQEFLQAMVQMIPETASKKAIPTASKQELPCEFLPATKWKLGCNFGVPTQVAVSLVADGEYEVHDTLLDVFRFLAQTTCSVAGYDLYGYGGCVSSFGVSFLISSGGALGSRGVIELPQGVTWSDVEKVRAILVAALERIRLEKEVVRSNLFIVDEDEETKEDAEQGEAESVASEGNTEEKEEKDSDLIVQALLRAKETNDVQQAVLYIDALKVPEILQAEQLCNLLSFIVESGVEDVRSFGFELIVAMYLESLWSQESLVEGFGKFLSRYTDAIQEGPDLGHDLYAQMVHAFHPLFERGLLPENTLLQGSENLKHIEKEEDINVTQLEASVKEGEEVESPPRKTLSGDARTPVRSSPSAAHERDSGRRRRPPSTASRAFQEQAGEMLRARGFFGDFFACYKASSGRFVLEDEHHKRQCSASTMAETVDRFLQKVGSSQQPIWPEVDEKTTQM